MNTALATNCSSPMATRDPYDWKGRHDAAWRTPRGIERPIVELITGLDSYTTQHERAYGSPIADDGFLGPAWLNIAKSINRLLNGDLGRLDGGTLDRTLREIVVRGGESPDEI